MNIENIVKVNGRYQVKEEMLVVPDIRRTCYNWLLVADLIIHTSNRILILKVEFREVFWKGNYVK